MTLFLFKAIGLHFLIIGLSVVLNKKVYKKLIKELAKEPSLLNFIFGFITLIVGILMVLAHNTWSSFPEILVSLYAWIALIKGTTLLVFPTLYKKAIRKMDRDSVLNFVGLVYLALGLYVTYTAFS